jgi:hypothetical protein
VLGTDASIGNSDVASVPSPREMTPLAQRATLAVAAAASEKLSQYSTSTDASLLTPDFVE